MQTTVTPKWTVEAGTKANNRGNFIQVPQGHKLVLVGAPRIWSRPETQNYYYHVGYRIAGNPDDISAALRQAGISQIFINTALQNAITRDNYQNTMKSLYNQTIAADQKQREKLFNETKNGIDELVINILDRYIVDAVGHTQNKFPEENTLIRRAYRETIKKLQKLQNKIQDDIISRYEPDEDDEYEED